MKRTGWARGAVARPGYYFSTVLLCGLDYCEMYEPGESGKGFAVVLLPASDCTRRDGRPIRFWTKNSQPLDATLTCAYACVEDKSRCASIVIGRRCVSLFSP